jgi:hypothetical protein
VGQKRLSRVGAFCSFERFRRLDEITQLLDSPFQNLDFSPIIMRKRAVREQLFNRKTPDFKESLVDFSQ